MTEFNWTPSQKDAITTLGRSLLVSAGAGSGKTAVLAERCVHLVMDARPACNIDQLLVVTFTDAAAGEMRARIADALRERFAGSSGDARLRHQLLLLDSASISTIHSFCRRVLNRHFADAQLDPQTPLMDAHEAGLLRERTARRIFDEWARRDDRSGEAFLHLLDAYGGHNETNLLKQLLEIDAFLDSVVDPDAWLRDTLEDYASSDPDRLSGTWLDALRGALTGELSEQLGTLDRQLLEWNTRSDVVSGFIPCLVDYRDHLEGWLERIEKDNEPEGLDRLCREDILAYDLPARPQLNKTIKEQGPEAVHDFEQARDCVKHIRENLFQKNLRDAFGPFSTADWAEGIARTAPHVQTLRRLLQTLRTRCHAAKADLGVIDFSDLERLTLNLLRDTGNGVAGRLRDEFEHVLVDEFQDVNRLQAEILRLVSRESNPSRADNLFVVGDVKQSIYRFRLAEPRLFIERQETFQEANRQGDDSGPGRVIPLADNFRSRSNVIDAVNAIFRKLMAPDLGGIAYDDQAELKCGRKKDPPLPGPAIELHVLDPLGGGDNHDAEEDDPSDAFDWERIEREAYVIAKRIRALKDSGHDYGDLVILLRAMKTHTHLLVRTLLKLGVPVFAEVSGGLFDALEVMDILSLLALLDNEQLDIPLAAALRSPLFGPPLNDSDLVEIRTAAGSAVARLPFHAAVRRYAKQGADAKLRSRLGDILRKLRDWRRRMGCRPVADVLWEIYEESGYWAYAGGLSEGGQRRANLLQLHEYARRFGDFERQGLARFLGYLDGIRESGNDLDTGSVAAPAGDVVRIMTIHRSKGLQFPIVIVGELGKRFNLSDARGSILFDRRRGLGLEAVDPDRRIRYPTLPHRLVAESVKTENLAEELRVLYVALTRAKDRLILVGTGPAPGAMLTRPGLIGTGKHADHEACQSKTVNPQSSIVNRQSSIVNPKSNPLPLLDRRGASGMLAWIAAAVAAQPPGHAAWTDGDEDAPDTLFSVRNYTTGEMRSWSMAPAQPSAAGDRLDRLSRMEPLDGPLPADESAPIVGRVARRLTTPYAADALTRVPAVAAASVLKRRWNAMEEDTDPAATWLATEGRTSSPVIHRRIFKTPDFMSAGAAPEPTHVGTWTHEFLQRLDLTRPCDRSDLQAQLDAHVALGAVTGQEAAAIDLDAVAWFFGTPLGARIREKSTRRLREWPFVLGVDPARYDPRAASPESGFEKPLRSRDRQGAVFVNKRGPIFSEHGPEKDSHTPAEDDVMLVRGIIDLLFDAGEGWEILDYKTDHVAGEALQARAAEYRGQLQIYAAAVEAAWRRPPCHHWLVFLNARTLVEV